MKKTVSQIKGVGDIAEQWAAMREGVFETREVEMTPEEIALKLSSDFSYRVLLIPFCILHGLWQGCVEAWSSARGD